MRKRKKKNLIPAHAGMTQEERLPPLIRSRQAVPKSRLAMTNGGVICPLKLNN